MDTEDDLDDTPLFTRQSSQKLLRDASLRSVNSKRSIRSRTNLAKEDAEAKYRLSFLISTMFATVLEDALTQIRILDECNNELRIYKTNKEMGELRRAKYGIPPCTNEDELADVDPKDLTSEHHKLNKLANDRKYCGDILTNTYLELSLKKTFTTLVQAKVDVRKLREHYINLVEDEARNKLLNREIGRQLRQQRNRSRSIIYDSNVAVEKLRNEVEDAGLHKEARDRYIVKWERAREEQHRQSIVNIEKGPSENIAYYRKLLDTEQRVHYEQELHTNILINDILRRLDTWVDKYDDDTAEVDLKIQLKKLEASSQKEKRLEMEKMLVVHEEQIKNWKQFKEDREKKIQYNNMMTAAALVVQAWWRGLLVRQELGPYKPKKKPPPKEKPNKKKK